jgi:hypothetical protein
MRSTVWSDSLTTDEAEATRAAIDRLRAAAAAQPLITRLTEAGGVARENKPLMFEVRFADELRSAGIDFAYEFDAVGSSGSTIDFAFATDVSWLVECVSIKASEAAKRAVRQVGMIYEQSLSSIANDQRQSPQGEMILAEQKIAEKVYRTGRPIKFPEPRQQQYHMILVDTRGYLDGGGDNFDYRQMAYGWRGIPRDEEWLIHWWRDAEGKHVPVSGLFEQTNPLKGAATVRERIHFIGFVREEDYEPDEIRRRCYVLANPHLFADEAAARFAWLSYPLRRPEQSG